MITAKDTKQTNPGLLRLAFPTLVFGTAVALSLGFIFVLGVITRPAPMTTARRVLESTDYFRGSQIDYTLTRETVTILNDSVWVRFDIFLHDEPWRGSCTIHSNSARVTCTLYARERQGVEAVYRSIFTDGVYEWQTGGDTPAPARRAGPY